MENHFALNREDAPRRESSDVTHNQEKAANAGLLSPRNK